MARRVRILPSSATGAWRHWSVFRRRGKSSSAAHERKKSSLLHQRGGKVDDRGPHTPTFKSMWWAQMSSSPDFRYVSRVCGNTHHTHHGTANGMKGRQRLCSSYSNRMVDLGVKPMSAQDLGSSPTVNVAQLPPAQRPLRELVLVRAFSLKTRTRSDAYLVPSLPTLSYGLAQYRYASWWKPRTVQPRPRALNMSSASSIAERLKTR